MQADDATVLNEQERLALSGSMQADDASVLNDFWADAVMAGENASDMMEEQQPAANLDVSVRVFRIEFFWCK